MQPFHAFVQNPYNRKIDNENFVDFQMLATLDAFIGKDSPGADEMSEILINQPLLPKSTLYENARKRRTKHEKAGSGVQNPYNLEPVPKPCGSLGKTAKASEPQEQLTFVADSPSMEGFTTDDSTNTILSSGPVSTVAVRVLGKDEVSGSIPLPGTIPLAMKTTARGSLSEAEVMVTLARLGASVFTPAIGHDHPFDLIAHWQGQLSRVQVKTMRDCNSGSIVMSGATVVDRKGGKQWPVITAADCDVIIGWYPPEARAYVVRPQGKTLYTFRRLPPKNNQLLGVWFESDFRLTRLDQLF